MAGAVNEDTLYPSTRTIAYPDVSTGYDSSILVDEITDITLFKQNNYGYTLNEFVDLLDSTDDFNYNLGMVTKPEERGDYLADKLKSDVPVVDKDWVRSRFMISSEDLTEKDTYSRFNTRADWKFESTGWGCHHVINPLPQFTRYCDIRRNMIHSGMKSIEGIDHTGTEKEGGTIAYSADLGMGRYYSEAIDDHSQYVYMQFGTPGFNSMFSFFKNAAYYQDTYLATHGRYPIEFNIAKSVTATMVGLAYPFTSLIVFVIKTVYKVATSFSPFSYYYLNPNMHMYWGNVNSIVTSMAVELGMLSPLTDETLDTTDQQYRNKSLMAVPITFDQNDIEDLKAYLPDIFPTGYFGSDGNTNGKRTTLLNTNYIDVYSLATRHTRRVTAMRHAMLEKIEAWDSGGNNSYTRAAMLAGYVNNPDLTDETKSSLKDLIHATKLQGTNDYWDADFVGFLRDIFTGKPQVSAVSKIYNTLRGYTDTDVKSSVFFQGGESTDKGINIAETKMKEEEKGKQATALVNTMADKIKAEKDLYFSNIPTSDDFSDPNKDKSNWESVMTNAANITAAVQRDGGMFAGFRVEYTGEASDSFSNSTSQLEIGNAYKSAVGTVRNFKFSLSGGNLLPGLDSVLAVAKNVVAGALDGATFGLSSVVMSALSGAFVDFPEKWEESTANLYTANYNIKLIAPYGNMISQLQNIYIPLAMLLAGALPLSVGKASHASPMICNLFSKGVQNIELGIITDISITRGTSNLPFDSWRRPLAIDVSFTVKDLSPIVAVPINKSIWANFMPGNMSNIIPDLITEGNFDKYIGTLCARDLYGMRFYAPQFFRNLRKASMRASQGLSITNAAFSVGETINFFSGLFVRDYTIGAATQNNKF